MFNNTSYRQFSVSGGPTNFTFSPVGNTVRTQPAIMAWTSTGATVNQVEPAPGNDGIWFMGYKLTIGGVVKHVALPRVTLAPGVLVWSNICRLGKIGGTRIGWRVQIVGLNNNPVGHTVVHVPGMIVRRGRRISPREKAGERVDPSARSQIWSRIETGRIRVRASRA